MNNTSNNSNESPLFVRNPSRVFLYEDSAGNLVRVAYILLMPTNPAAANAIPLLFEHGGGARKEGGEIFESLAINRPFVWKDHRGEGSVLEDGKCPGSGLNDYALTPEQLISHGLELDPNVTPKLLAEDNVALAKFLFPNHKKIHFFGLSLGGMVTVNVAAYYPESVASLILLATTPNFLAHLGETFHHLSVPPVLLPATRVYTAEEEAASKRIDAQLMKDITGTFTPEFIGSELFVKALTLLGQYPTSRHAYIVSVTWMLKHSVEDIITPDHPINSNKVPVLIIHGDADKLLLPSSAKSLVNLFPQAEMHWYPGVGHGVFLERLNEVQTNIDDFTRKIE